MGKHCPFPHSKPDAESFPVRFLNRFGNGFSVAGLDLRISRFQPSSTGVGWFEARAGEFSCRIPKSSQQTQAVNVTSCSGAL